MSNDIRYLIYGVVAAGYMTMFYDVGNYILEHGFDDKWLSKAILGLVAVGIGIGVILALKNKARGD